MVIAGCAICLVAISLILLLLYMINRRSSDKVTLDNNEEAQIIRNYRKQQTLRQQQSMQGRQSELVPVGQGEYPS